jgi:hypothetical protein
MTPERLARIEARHAAMERYYIGTDLWQDVHELLAEVRELQKHSEFLLSRINPPEPKMESRTTT